MNAHLPQSSESMVELEEIAAIPHHIITPRHAKPMIGVYQDTLVGSYRLTQTGIEFTRREFMNLMMWNKRFDGNMPPPRAAERNRWTGQQVLGALMPPINMEMGNKSYDSEKHGKDSDSFVKIVQGDIQQGVVDADIYMKPSKGIIHVTYNDHGPKETVDLLDALQNTVESFLVMNGFSVGISDLIADDDTKKQIDAKIQERKKQVDNLILQLHLDLFDNNTGKTNQQEFEDQIFGILNQATSDAGSTGQQSLSVENRLLAMVRSGSKGEPLNVAQMMACLGQTAIEGKRVPYGFTDRTLPHYKKYDDSAESRGFIESSFIRGLTPQQFFFHAMSGREGLIDTAVKTADTGYIQRQLIKSMEDLTIQHDGTVRDANGNIIQFHYGEDGVNPTKIETQSLPIGKASEEDIRREFGLEAIDWSTVLVDGTVRENDQEAITEFVQQVLYDRRMLVEGVFQMKSTDSGGIFAPVNLARWILNIKTRFGLSPSTKTDLIPAVVLEGIKTIISRTHTHHKIWAALLRFYLAPHKLIVKERFTKDAFEMLMELIVVSHMKAWVQPGDQVGIVAAQSIGEPATQMSCIGSTVIYGTNSKGERFYGAIRDFIDPLLAKNLDKVQQIAQDSVVLPMEEDYFIVGVSDDEKTSWKRISEISRHPANGGMVEVVTRSGRRTTATLSHSFLKRATNGIVPVLGSDLEVGMRIPIARVIPESPDALTHCDLNDGMTIQLDKSFGWICGMYLADGSFSGNSILITKIHPIVEEKVRQFAELYGFPVTVRQKECAFGPSKDNIIYSKALKDFLNTHFKTGSYGKEIGAFVFHANKEFIAGVIGGFFDGDGNVHAGRQMIRASSRSSKLIEQMTALLGYCGMFGVMSQETSVRMLDKIQYTMQIPRKFAKSYKEQIGFCLSEKAEALDQIIEYNEREDAHSEQEGIDKIPELGEVIAETGKLLRMPGQSRTYGRWRKKESIGRRTLQRYIGDFEEMMAIHVDQDVKQHVEENIAILRSAAYSDVIWDEIVELIRHEDPQEYVYDFTVPGNDSFMVDCNVLVHNTLNSVDWDTEIVLTRKDQVVYPKIGDWIDAYIHAYENDPSKRSKIQYLPNNQIYIPMEEDMKAMSCDEDGKVMWTKVEAVTRHPVVNHDGTDTILKVTLESGREVKATKGKSFLTLQGGKILEQNGSELKIGDKLPILNHLATDMIASKTQLSLRDILSPKEYIYGTEVEIARNIMNTSVDRHWFQKNQGVHFTVPYARSDSFRAAFQHGHNSNDIRVNHVYPAHMKTDVSQIPDTIELTRSFGFFCGAYVAEGMSNTTQIHIANNDATYLQQITELMASWNVGTHTVSKQTVIESTGISGRSTTLIIHSTILAKVMSTLFGRVSYEKHLPDWTIQAPDAFLKGFMDGYISGDGTVDKRSCIIHATSVSSTLITDIQLILAKYNIYSTVSSRLPPLNQFKSVSMCHTLTIPAKYARRFASTFTLSVKEKQERLNTHMASNKSSRTSKWSETADVVWDKIKSIEEIAPMKDGWMYDITVEGTRNFTTKTLIGQKDTFHQAGVASKSAVTRGVPRLRELLKVTQNPKATSLTIHLKPEYRSNKDKAREVVQDLELTVLRNITEKVSIYWDEKDLTTVVEDDRELMEFYAQFEEELIHGHVEEDVWSKWVLRLELNREEMFNRNISIQDVVMVMKAQFANDINVVYTDYNSDKLVMRIRLPNNKKEKDTASNIDDFTNLKKFQNKLLNSIVIRGLPGIKAVTFRKDKNSVESVNGKYEQVEQYVLDTDGSNFIKVMNHPAVDGNRLYSTNVWDVYEVLGIEATRAVLFNEINGLFESVGINYRHLCLLCDVMTRFGRLMSIDRYGINKNDIGTLAKASFEETEKILLKAALFGEVDPVTGVSANIMMGQPIRGGTAFSQILLDDQMLPQLLKDVDVDKTRLEEEKDGDLSTLEETRLMMDDPCASTRFQTSMVLPEGKELLDEPDIEMVILDE